MKAAETLLSYMDHLHRIIGLINNYLDRGLEFVQRAKEWVEKILVYLEQAIDALAKKLGGRKSDSKNMNEEYLFV